MAEFEVHGLAALDKALKEFPAKLEGNVLRGAMRAGVRVFRDLARANVPVQSGKLRKSIRIKTSLRNGKASATLVAGNKDAFYAHMVEFGTARHWIKPRKRRSLLVAGMLKETVDHPGGAPKPFMRPAFDEGVPAAIEAAKDYIAQRIEKELAK